MGLKVWSLLLSVLTLSSYSHSLLSVSQSLLPVADPARHQFCLSVVDLCLSIFDLCSSSSIFALRSQRPNSSSPPSLRYRRSISSLRFVYLWICGFVDLFFGFVDLLFRFEDLLILFFKNWSSVFDLCISVEIKADHRPPEPDPTRPVAFGGWRRVWNFSTRSDRVSCGLGTNPTRTDPWTAPLSIARLSIEPLELSFSIAVINFNPSRFLRIRLDSFLTDFQSIKEVSVCLIDAR